MGARGVALSTRPGTHVLFFDMAEIDTMDRVVRSVCSADKHPLNPVMQTGDLDAWDSAQASPWPMRTVIHDKDEDIFKVWYGGTHPGEERKWRGGYAVSADGVVWEKPSLGLVEYNGNRRNNIILNDPYGCVVKDEAERDPNKRYKMLVTRACRYSADGIHWGDRVRVPMRLPGPRATDPVVFVRDDQDPDPSRRWKFVYQYYDSATKPGPEKGRMKGIAFGREETRWRGGRDNPILSPNDGFEHENHFLMYIPYEGQYLLLYECGWYHPDGTGRFGAYSADIRLAHSRDGEHFTRIRPDQVVIPRGEAGEWDGQFLVISDKAVIHDDRIHLYYAGQGTDWPSWPPGNAAPGICFPPGCMSLSQMGLASLRLDGFTCVHTVDAHSFGVMTTKPFRHDPAGRSQLEVNLAGTRPRRDWLQVEVLDGRTGQSLPGFTAAGSAPMVTDDLCATVRWRGRGLGAVRSCSVRLRFLLFGAARLHSFRFVRPGERSVRG